MKFNVTEVEFDFDEFGDGNPEWQLTFDEVDLEDKVHEYMQPYKIRSLEFENNRPHSLTAYK